jgi:hypothetical protein
MTLAPWHGKDQPWKINQAYVKPAVGDESWRKADDRVIGLS